MLVATGPMNPNARVLASTKCNLAESPNSVSFTIETAPNGASCVVWGGVSEFDALDLLSETMKREGTGERDFAKEAVAFALSNGPMSFKDICAVTRAEGLSESMARKALHDLRCLKRVDGFQGRWTWELPDFSDFDGREDQ